TGGPNVADQRVGRRDQPPQHRLAFRMLQIECQAALVAVHRYELTAHAAIAELTGIAPSVAGRALDLDDLGAPVTQGLRAERSEQDVRQVENTVALQRAGRLGHFRRIPRSIGLGRGLALSVAAGTALLHTYRRAIRPEAG